MSSDVMQRDSARVIGPARSIVNHTLWFEVESADATEPVRHVLPTADCLGKQREWSEGSDVSRSTASNVVPSAATSPLPREVRG